MEIYFIVGIGLLLILNYIYKYFFNKDKVLVKNLILLEKKLCKELEKKLCKEEVTIKKLQTDLNIWHFRALELEKVNTLLLNKLKAANLDYSIAKPGFNTPPLAANPDGERKLKR